MEYTIYNGYTLKVEIIDEGYAIIVEKLQTSQLPDNVINKFPHSQLLLSQHKNQTKSYTEGFNANNS